MPPDLDLISCWENIWWEAVTFWESNCQENVQDSYWYLLILNVSVEVSLTFQIGLSILWNDSSSVTILNKIDL